ncbi:hypothetical protein A9Q99_09800 [Gammaproteobacteria bacterium 45_16_T64]|nr:hypothetical protein A9Q99_09800 [Gammaproteobacteria bacterium 45_16_T64]
MSTARSISNKLTAVLIAFLALLTVSTLATARAIDEESYYVFQANADDGGYLYLQARDEFILIANDIVIPIALGSDTPSYQTALGVVSALEGQQLEPRTTLPIFSDLVQTKYLVGDVTGDGVSEIFIPALGVFITGLEGEHGGNPYILAQYSEIDGIVVNYYDALTNTLIVKPGLSFDLKDLNGDGRFDLVIKQPGSADQVVSADVDGKFSTGSNGDVAEPGTTNSSANLEGATIVAGAVAGSFSVESGAANYSISLSAPTGTAGVTPKFSLSYNSNVGNGTVGLGWSLNGLTMITRCAKNYLHDGKRSIEWYGTWWDEDPNGAPFDFDAEQNLCLDGQKLVLVSGEYWKDGAEYRTEQESFVQIKQHSDSSSAWFEVKHKSGDVFQYGNTSTSKAVLGNRTTTWSVNRIEDAAGNYMSYEYDASYAQQGTTLIQRIDYTGNDAANLAPYNAVVFDYEIRPSDDYILTNDPNSGQKYFLKERLSKVTSLVEGEVYRRYVLGYRTDVDDASMLKEIYECNGSGECSNPTVVDWTPDNSTYEITDANQLVGHFGDSEIDNDFDYEVIQYPDVNGDGYRDLCGRTKDGVKCVLGTPSGFDGEVWVTAICKDGSPVMGFGVQCDSKDNYKTIAFLDVNGDGFDDLVWRGDNGVGVSYASPSEGKFGLTQQGFLGPESTDLQTNIAANRDVLASDTNEDDNKYSVRFPDINGDALPDLCYRNDTNGVVCYLNNSDVGDSFSGWDMVNPIITGICKDGDSSALKCNSTDNHKTINYVDLNGDGMDDLFFRSDTYGLTYLISKGNSFSDSKFWFTYCNNGNSTFECEGEDDYNFQFMDVNADGLKDVCWTTRYGKVHCVSNPGMYFSNGRVMTLENPFNSALASSNGDGAPVTQFNDFNADGKPDAFVLTQNHQGSIIYLAKASDSGISIEMGIASTGTFCLTECSKRDVYNTIRFVDTNGDGVTEVVHRTSNGIKIYNVDVSPRAGYLAKITNGFGLETSVEYSDLNDAEVYDKGSSLLDVTYPRRRSVGNDTLVKSVSSSDGTMAGTKVTSSYFYTGRISHLAGGGSLGFESVKISKELDSGIFEENITEYSTDYRYHTAGMPSKTVSKIGGVTVSESMNYYDVLFYDTNDAVVDNVPSIFNGEKYGAVEGLRYLSFTKTNISKQYDPVTGVLLTSTSKEITMGSYGDVLSSRDIVSNGILSGSATQPVSISSIVLVDGVYVQSSYLVTEAINEYVYNDASRWFLGKLSETTVTKSGITFIDDINGAGEYTNTMEPITRKSRWTYFSDTGAVKTESIVLVDDAGVETIDTIKEYEFASDNDGRSYPNFGVPNRVTDYEFVGGVKANPRSTATFSDPKGRFSVADVDTLGNTTYTTFHPVLGSKQTVTGPNGLTVVWEYDGWGREVLRTNPDGTWAKTDVIGCGEGGVSCPVAAASYERAIYYIRSESSGKAPVYAFMDRYGRTVQTRSVGLGGQTIYQDRYFNKYGQEYRVDLPSFTQLGTLSEVSEFDSSGRLVKTIKPGGTASIGGVEQEVLYDGLNQTLLNRYQKADGTGSTTQMKKLYYDPFGRVIQTQDYLNNVVRSIYDAYGNEVETRVHYSDLDSEDYVIAMSYDEMGRKVSMDDPSKGHWRYIYSKRGELVLQEDGNGVKICHQYDSVGRLIRRYDNYAGTDENAVANCVNGISASAEWVYDTAPKIGGGVWTGKLYQVKGENGYQETYSYDDMGRVTNALVTIDGSTFITTSVFDELGRVKETFYPSADNDNRLQVINQYNENGYLTAIEDGEGVHYWKALTADSFGRITEESLGAGVISTNKSYNAYNGTVTNIRSTHFMGSIGGLQDDEFLFDGVGNLAHRKIRAEGIDLTENYTFDIANRLTNVEFIDANNSAMNNTTDMSYMGNGNIKKKHDIGDYLYGQSCSVNGVDYQPSSHALTSVIGAKASAYCYDVVGNLLSGGGRSVEWSAFNKPTRIEKGDNNVQLVYGPDRKRIQRIDVANGKTTRTTYLGKAYEKIEKHDGSLEEKHYIAGIAVVSIKDRQVADAKTNFLLKDHLGSTTATVAQELDNGGIDVQRLAYDPWGKRRNAINWQAIDDNIIVGLTDQLITNRGFTGHEMLDSVGLIHMNGRVYDPELGRFLSADPIVQAPTNSQSYNRYSYVANNPVSYTDPSGFSWFKKIKKSIGKAFKRIAKAYYRYSGLEAQVRFSQRMTVATAKLLAKNPALATVVQIVGCVITVAVGCALIVGAVTALQTYGVTGDWQMAFRAGVIAGATAFISAQVNGYIGDTFKNGIANVAAHAAFSGAMSAAQGGSFWSGAAAGAVSSTIDVNGWTHGLDPVSSTVVAGFVGGTVSRITGGKFANGARTAAMAHIFNDLAHRVKDALQDFRWARKISAIKSKNGADAVKSKRKARLMVDKAANEKKAMELRYDAEGWKQNTAKANIVVEAIGTASTYLSGLRGLPGEVFNALSWYCAGVINYTTGDKFGLQANLVGEIAGRVTTPVIGAAVSSTISSTRDAE